MDNIVTFRLMGQNLGFSVDAFNSIFKDKGVNSVQAMESMSDGDIINLMRVVQKPGGGDDGVAVSFVAERKFMTACHMVRYQVQVQQPVTFNDNRTNALGPLIVQRTMEEEQKSLPQPEVPTID